MTSRVLVVDDNPANLKLLQFLLAKHGYEVRTASDGPSAVELLRSFAASIILVDLHMPGQDGYALTRQLKADPATQDIYVIAVTAHAMRGDEERARAAGCDGYLTKPIDTRTLPAVVAEYASRRAREPE